VAPLDPRLVRSVAAVRAHLAVTVLAAALRTGLILVQAWLLAHAVARATAGAPLPELLTAVGWVAAAALARAALAAVAETAALRGAAAVQSALRRALLRRVATAGAPPAGAGEVVTLATRGLDGLRDYVAGFLPQLVLAVLVPVAVLAVVGSVDLVSALVIGFTVPLVPVFMALVGWHTRARTDRQWRLLERLGGHFLDVVQGLPTLALFRRSHAAAAEIRRVTDAHRSATMGTLRVAFLSAFVLELLSTLAVALVAVQIGLRLLYGWIDLETALLVLVLAPEAYLPLREVGARFHASAEGASAVQRVFAVLDAPVRVPAGRGDGAAIPAAPDIRLDRLRVDHPGRDAPAVDDLTLHLAGGRTTLLTGPSGAGKSTLVGVLARLVEPTGGRVRLGGDQQGPDGALDLADVAPDAWRRRIAWVPQRPYLFDAPVIDNIRLGAPDATDADVRAAARAAGLHEVVAALPDGYATRLGERGTRLSSGQRQRVALARAFLRRAGGADVVLLDEPTAHLDPDTAASVRTAAAALLRGATALVVAHDEGWAQLADAQVRLDPPAPPPSAPLPSALRTRTGAPA
jgi:ATP-binding cassette, subfamily C, bacterial CydD